MGFSPQGPDGGDISARKLTSQLAEVSMLTDLGIREGLQTGQQNQGERQKQYLRNRGRWKAQT